MQQDIFFILISHYDCLCSSNLFFDMPFGAYLIRPHITFQYILLIILIALYKKIDCRPCDSPLLVHIKGQEKI